jgi:hypothetical protein
MPGTRFFDNVHQQLGAIQNWQDSQDMAMLYHGPFSTAFYRQLHTVVHREFRARKSWQSFSRTRILRDLARFGFNLLRLPAARVRLELLAHEAGSTLPALPHMPHEVAAVPSQQDNQ